MGMWDRPSVEELKERSISEEHALKRVLGPTELVLLGVGAIVGAGLFSITGIAAAENTGPAIILAFLIAAVGCCFAGLCYCELAAMIPVSGSAYTYAYATMGQLIAWIMGWDLILEYAVGAAAVAISWSAYVVSLLHDADLHLPAEWIASHWHATRMSDGTLQFGTVNTPALFIICAISGLLMFGIKGSTKFNNVIVIIKVVAVLLFIGFGAFYINTANYSPFIPPNTGEYGDFGWSGILRGAGVLFFAFIGFDAVSTAAQETKNPQRDLPIGILGSLAICTVLYLFFGFVMTGLVNYKELGVADPVALAIDRTPFWWLHGVIKLAILAGLTSVILVMLYGQSRIFYAMSRDGLLPAVFSRVHPRLRTPWISNVLLMLFTGSIASFAPISAVGHMTSIGTLLAFIIVCIGVLVLRYAAPEMPRPFKVPFCPAVPILGIGVCFAMMFSLDEDAWFRLLIWMAVGMLIYVTRPFFDSSSCQR